MHQQDIKTSTRQSLGQPNKLMGGGMGEGELRGYLCDGPVS